MHFSVFKFCKNKTILFVLLFFCVSSEFIGISLIYPFIVIFFDLEIENIAILNLVFQYLKNFSVELSKYNILGLILSFFIFNAIFLLIYRYLITMNGLEFMNFLRTQIYYKTFESEYKNSSKKISKIYNSITLQSLEAGNALMLQFQILETLISLLIILILSLFISIKITILSFIIGIIFFLSLSFTLYISKKYGRERYEYNESLYKNLNIAFQNIRYLKAINTFNNFFIKIKPTLTNILNTHIKFTMLSKGTKILNEPLVLICLAIILFISIRYFNTDTGIIIVILAILRRMYSKIVSIISSLQQYNREIVSYKYCNDLINNLKKTRESNENNKYLGLQQNITINNLTYNNGNENLYENTSIKFLKNKTTLIYGKSGTGKSTLLNIILGLIKIKSGQIYFDENEINVLDKNSIRKNIGFVNQEPVIFNLSLRENLKIRNQFIKEERIYNFLKLFSLNTLVNKNKNNLNFAVDEKSSNLSGGEKQRIAFIREVIFEPEILILDEP
ncbi:ABC transporter ATP-binding protein/permease, partial [Pelagibacteraceae bacterium]|nr:ABC transporter ATP-binding protein/permease [Pelagibacteraceae bacterium]